MELHLLVIDDFFDAPEELRYWSVRQGFKDEISPVDGLPYKGVCKKVPWIFDHEAGAKLAYLLNNQVNPFLSFTRLTTKNVATRWIHIDMMYAKYVLVVYLNTVYPEDAGTKLFRHPSFYLKDGITKPVIDIWDRDCNDESKWIQIGQVPMKWNRAVIYPTELFHAYVPERRIR